MKLPLILFGVSAGTVALRSVLTAWIFAAEASRVGVATSGIRSLEMFPELLSVAAISALCGVVAAWVHIWRSPARMWIRIIQMIGVLLVAFLGFGFVIDPPRHW